MSARETYVALLYSIVLGGGRRVVMSELRAMAEGLGLASPRTLVATGNLVFEAEPTTPVAALERRLEAAFRANFGRHVDVIIRPAPDWRRLAAGNPFPEASLTDAGRVIVRVMRRPVPDETVADLARYLGEGERMQAVDGDLWVHFARGVSGSRLAAAMTPRRLGGAGTSRNWNTVRRLAGMLDGMLDGPDPG